MAVIPSKAGLAQIPGAQRIAVSSVPSRRGWGIALAVGGVVLVALNLRAAVVALSPIYGAIGESFPVGAAAQGVIGTLPVLSFAVFGALGPGLARRVGLERSLVIAMALVCLGQVLRAGGSHSAVTLGLFSVVCLGGVGLANVLLPPAITHYFPRAIGRMTSLYAVLTAVGASVPAMVAVPLSHALGWRVSIGVWSVLALLAALPWLGLMQAHDAGAAAKAPAAYAAWRWPTSWAIMILFSVGALDMYALIAWLPELLTGTAGVGAATAGLMLSVYNLIGLPHSLLVPMLLARMRRPILVVAFATLCTVAGTLGLAYGPGLAWLWIVPAGLGAMFVPIGLTLINLRSRTEAGTTALSSFVQSGGYLIAAAGPVLVGALKTATGGWVVPCWFMALAGVAAGIAGLVAVRPVEIEDMAGRRAP